MTDLLSKAKQGNVLVAKEESVLNWTEILSKLKKIAKFLLLKILCLIIIDLT